MAQAFDFQKLLSDPTFNYGMTLLGSRGSRNPYADAAQQMMQIQQFQAQVQQRQAAAEEAKRKAELEEKKRAFSLQSYRQPAQEAQPAQPAVPFGLGAFKDPRMTEAKPAMPAQEAGMNWEKAASDYMQMGGDPSDLKALRDMLEPEEKKKTRFMPVGGNSVFDVETQQFIKDPQLHAQALDELNKKAEIKEREIRLEASLRKPSNVSVRVNPIVQTQEGVFERTPGGLKQLTVPGTGKPLTGKTPAGGAASGTASKPIPRQIVNEIQEARSAATELDTISKDFKPNYGGKGVLGVGADAQLKASAIIGKDKKSVAWWKRYRKNTAMVERHKNFGAALTPTELANWKAADVDPGMDSDVIAQNLKIRAALARKVLQSTKQDYVDAGYGKSAVESIAGRQTAVPTEQPPAPAQAAPAKPAGGAMSLDDYLKKHRK